MDLTDKKAVELNALLQSPFSQAAESNSLIIFKEINILIWEYFPLTTIKLTPLEFGYKACIILCLLGAFQVSF